MPPLTKEVESLRNGLDIIDEEFVDAIDRPRSQARSAEVEPAA
jgi:hypothetical protein